MFISLFPTLNIQVEEKKHQMIPYLKALEKMLGGEMKKLKKM